MTGWEALWTKLGEGLMGGRQWGSDFPDGGNSREE